MVEKNNFKRQVAHKVRIKDLNEGSFVQKEGWEPSFVLTKDNRELSRVNIIATIVSPVVNEGNFSSIGVDDGTGNISVKSFENSKIFKEVQIGNHITIIGRPREFNKEKYLVPDIIKKIEDPSWIKVREIELRTLDKNIDEKKIGQPQENSPKTEQPKEEQKPKTQPQANINVEKKVEEVKPPEIKETKPKNIITIIKELDPGSGADTDSVIEQSNNPNSEKLINNLLLEGEIFEISPGKLKVLE